MQSRDRPWHPAKIYSDIESISLEGKLLHEFEVRLGALRYQSRLQLKPWATWLFVFLSSSRKMPRFLPANFDIVSLDAHSLGISDPALLLDDRLEVGTFYGTRDQDAVFDVVRIAEKIAACVELNRSRIVYWGFSGASIGAGMAAVKTGTQAVLVNPFLEGPNMAGSQLSVDVARIFGAASADDLNEQFPLRTSLSAALGAAKSAGLKSSLFIVQNLQDKGFFKRQYSAFCEHLDLPIAGGIDRSGTIRTLTYSDPSGHAPEPAAVRREILDRLSSSQPGYRLNGAVFANVLECRLESAGAQRIEIPAGKAHLALVSQSGFLGSDSRRLGVSIRKIFFDAAPVELTDPALVTGFHGIESNGPTDWRWTDGLGLLEIPKGTRKVEFEVKHSFRQFVGAAGS